MSFVKPLTQNMKAKATPIILERDYGNEEPWCIFCTLPFIFNHKYWRQVWEHLNNYDDDHRVENLAWPTLSVMSKRKTILTTK